MPDDELTSAVAQPTALLQMMTGYWVSQALYVAAKLGVADFLADRAQSAEDLATATQTDAHSLQRILRALASVGVFTEASPGVFALTPLAALLRSGIPIQCAPWLSCMPKNSTKPGVMCCIAYVREDCLRPAVWYELL